MKVTDSFPHNEAVREKMAKAIFPRLSANVKTWVSDKMAKDLNSSALVEFLFLANSKGSLQLPGEDKRRRSESGSRNGGVCDNVCIGTRWSVGVNDLLPGLGQIIMEGKFTTVGKDYPGRAHPTDIEVIEEDIKRPRALASFADTTPAMVRIMSALSILFVSVPLLHADDVMLWRLASLPEPIYGAVAAMEMTKLAICGVNFVFSYLLSMCHKIVKH
ncbi:hypothetical protein RHSIM_Rhsim03G0023100 [Rhododendron simsii]|uniref:Uncharacterized protein n=1 Tax=Rhododendron simsii TaxID=118357 RepID=A0A834H6C6_RHOSS|nr:hypothetical protein RHSIM_Rhsim03G0023100 [Rhododendron simsii]